MGFSISDFLAWDSSLTDEERARNHKLDLEILRKNWDRDIRILLGNGVSSGMDERDPYEHSKVIVIKKGPHYDKIGRVFNIDGDWCDVLMLDATVRIHKKDLKIPKSNL